MLAGRTRRQNQLDQTELRAEGDSATQSETEDILAGEQAIDEKYVPDQTDTSPGVDATEELAGPEVGDPRVR